MGFQRLRRQLLQNHRDNEKLVRQIEIRHAHERTRDEVPYGACLEHEGAVRDPAFFLELWSEFSEPAQCTEGEQDEGSKQAQTDVAVFT